MGTGYGSPPLGARGAQRLRTMRQRLTNTRKRTNLNSHLSNTPTQHLLVRVKNLYVTGRHKLRHTSYPGKEKSVGNRLGILSVGAPSGVRVLSIHLRIRLTLL
jgi:hypothetical protein